MRLALALVLLLAACAQHVDRTMGASNIGPVQFGMSAAEIDALGFPTTHDQVMLEGDAYDRISVDIEGEVVEVIFFDNRLADITTASAAFATDRNARVGATLAELRVLYPEGEVNIGPEEGGYFNFETQDHAFFDLDQTGVPPYCFEYNGECPDLGAQRSTGYRIRDLSDVAE